MPTIGLAAPRTKRDFHRMIPDYEMERALAAQGCRSIAGVDEVGRGPLAGPVVAAAVILDPGAIPAGLNDSKKLSRERLAVLEAAIHATARVGIGEASVEEIDRHNILQASFLAMRRAIAALPCIPDHVLVDGSNLPADLPCRAVQVIKGDGRCQSIAAASIVAKMWRDRIMWDLAQHYPGYGWETNVGYPSKCHKTALQNLGVTPHHRRSFKPVHNILYQAQKLTD